MNPPQSPRPSRAGGRAPGAIRSIEIESAFLRTVNASVSYRSGGTRVLCVATLEEGAPAWITTGHGWLTAEYALLPFSTQPRISRARGELRIDGRTQEIQRLIGRSLRASLDLHRIPGYTIRIDCEVLEADGGTRTAAINGATVALGRLVEESLEAGRFAEDPRVATLAAVSSGIVNGQCVLDLDYEEDRQAEVDLNVVGTAPTEATGSPELVEVQGSSESRPISVGTWRELTDLGILGVEQVAEALRAEVYPLG